jgi:hypothetical protein
MPNGKIGDHPMTDLFAHGRHPFPPDMEEMIRNLAAIRPDIVQLLQLDSFDWEQGKNLDEGRKRLKELIDDYGGAP